MTDVECTCDADCAGQYASSAVCDMVKSTCVNKVVQKTTTVTKTNTKTTVSTVPCSTTPSPVYNSPPPGCTCDTDCTNDQYCYNGICTKSTPIPVSTPRSTLSVKKSTAEPVVPPAPCSSCSTPILSPKITTPLSTPIPNTKTYTTPIPTPTPTPVTYPVTTPASPETQATTLSSSTTSSHSVAPSFTGAAVRNGVNWVAGVAGAAFVLLA
jgi:hypothetical protein